VAAPRRPDARVEHALPRWLDWHRRLGLVALAGVVLWSLSGVLHPIMVQLQPEPVRQQLDPRVLTLNNTVDPRPLLRAAGLATIQDLRVIEVDGRRSPTPATGPSNGSSPTFTSSSGSSAGSAAPGVTAWR